MVTGIAVLGVLAGAQASFFRLDQNGTAGPPADRPADTTATPGDAALAALTAEVAALRRQVEVLTRRLAGTPTDQDSNEPAPGADEPG